VSTRNGRIAAYRSFFGKAVQEGWRQDDPSLKLDRPRSRRGIPRPVEDLEAKMALLPPVYRHIAVLLSQTGMRLAELCRLDVPLPVSGRIDVLGKGSKWRRIPLTVKAQEALTALGGKVDVGPRAIQHAFRKVGMHPHALRHHFGCACAEAGVDAFVLQDLLGHASPATTRGYVMNSERRLREGISKLEASG